MAHKIAWTQATCNVFTGCRKVSAGCENCYAERQARRLKAMGSPYYQDVVDADGWTGKVQTNFKVLRERAARQKPTRIFVESMGDFFYERIQDALREGAFAVMIEAQQHTWQILTKRPGTAVEFFNDHPSLLPPDGWEHIWFGATIENQEAAAERIGHLLQLPTAVRFVSAEPLLGPIDLMQWLADCRCDNCGWRGCRDAEGGPYAEVKEYDGPDDLDGHWECPQCNATDEGCVHDYSSLFNPFGPDPRIDWLIIGCESRQGRPGRFCGPEFFSAALDLIVQCRNAGVPVFVKQIPSDDGKRVIRDSHVIAERLGYTVAEIRQWPERLGDRAP